MYSTYDTSRGCDIEVPEELRITSGPYMKTFKVCWHKDTKFFRVFDALDDKPNYLTSIETKVLTGCSYDYLRKRSTELRSTPKLFNDRYLIDCIPKAVFIRKTKRKYDSKQEYRDQY